MGGVIAAFTPYVLDARLVLAVNWGQGESAELCLDVPFRVISSRTSLLNRSASLMTPLSIFGLFAVTAMLVCYALEARSRWFILAFAGACALGSVYGFLQGAWPFGLVEGVWSAVAIRRWVKAGRVK